MFFLFCFQGRQTVFQKSEISVTLAEKVKQITLFGRIRRERRCAREEKEEGLLRTLIAFSRVFSWVSFQEVFKSFTAPRRGGGL